MISALTYLEEKGIVHGDMKLENFMYDKSSGIVKLIDFGLARKYVGIKSEEKKVA